MPLASKHALREHFINRRLTLAAPARDTATRAVCRRLVDFLATSPLRPACIAGYAPVRGELDILPALTGLAALGWQPALPRVSGPNRTIEFHLWSGGLETLAVGKFGIQEPTSGQRCHPDVILVPLVAFDPARNRLGYGKGYYDRTLPLYPQALSIGIGFSCQKSDALPTDAGDHPLGVILTEDGILCEHTSHEPT